MSKDIAYQVLIEDADRRYQRWYIALQSWVLSLLPLMFLIGPWWIAPWFLGCQALQWFWRRAHDRRMALRDGRVSQLIDKLIAENERLWRMLRDE